MAMHDDVNTAFLIGELREVVHIRFPPDMRTYDENSGEEMVGRLKKGMYGLKQSSRIFSDKVATVLQEKAGLTRSNFDPCVYFKRDKGEMLISIWFVDDALTFATSQRMYDEFRTALDGAFDLDEGKPASWWLNMDITRDRNARTISVSQEALIKSLGERFPFLKDSNASRAPKSPLPEKKDGHKTSFDLADGPTPARVDRTLQENYRSACGILLYAATKTRMDLCQAVSMASRVISNPGPKHWQLMEHLLRYAWHTADRALVLGGRAIQPGGTVEVLGYSDADWAAEANRRSTSGIITEFMGSLVEWKSKLQATVAKSTCAAEMIAASLCATSMCHLRNFIGELGFKLTGPSQFTVKSSDEAERFPSLQLCDNNGAIAAPNSTVLSARMKYLEIADMFVRDATRRNKIWLHYCPTDEMNADLLTKPLGAVKFNNFVSKYYKG